MPRSRQLAAIMFTDIEGYTAFMQHDEEKAIRLRGKHRQVFNSITEKHKGRILQYYGDGTLSIFDSAIDAVQCGIEMQLGFQKEPAVPVRIGIHTGDIIFSEEEIIGDSVNVASRIESLAVPGSVFISDKVYDEIKNQEAIETSMLKTFKLKNVKKPIEVYAISNVGLIVPNPEDIKVKSGTEPTPLPEKQEHPILATKLFIPTPRSKIVHRHGLVKQLQEGLHGKLTLISAPPGFGKTTLVSEWVAECNRPVAWLSLDEGDNDLTRFLTYLIAALKSIADNIGAGALDLLQSPQPPPTESILTALLNDITTIPDNFILVLDDYHVINTKSVDQALIFLLDHLPPQMHLAITTREDPDLPLPRLRVRGQLTELRATDLRFTSPEAAGFLDQVMGLKLSAKDMAALETLTEGWVAGLQLAALSMQGREDISGFIRAFSGDDRYIVDYLVEEVLRSQPHQVRNFLLQTSILDRLSGPLCDAVTDQHESKVLLETLERGNLFVVPLDDKRHWFRYHHLFADVLHAHSMKEQPDHVPTLHRRASEWYEHNGSPDDAVQHALAAGDFERAAGLIELAWPAMDRSCQTATWLSWVTRLSKELICTRPVLCVDYAWALLEAGKLEDGEVLLNDAERMLRMTEDESEQPLNSSAKMVVVDKEQFRSLPGTIATARAYIAQSLGDDPATMKYAQQALDLLPEGDYLQRGVPAVLLGFAQWANGDLEAAYKSFTHIRISFEKAGDISGSASITFVLADIKMIQGRLQDAVSIFEQALEMSARQGEPVLRGTEDLYRGIGELKHEQGDLEAAERHLLKSKKLFEQASLPEDWQYRLRLSEAQLKESQGDLEGALALLDEAEKLYHRSPLPVIRSIAGLRTRVWIKQGRQDEAQNWALERDLSVDDELSYLGEFEYLVLVRVLVARYKSEGEVQPIQEAIGLLDRLLKAAEEGKRTGSIIEILVLKALALKAQGDVPLALASLERALTLAESEGYVRIFVDEGIPMAQLLASTPGVAGGYVSKLLAVFEAEKQK